MNKASDTGRFRYLRWVGTLAVVAGFLGAAGTILVSIGYFGTDGIRDLWFLLLPWVAVITFGFLARFLTGARSTGASIALAVIGASLAGPALLSAAARLRWLNNPELWPAPSQGPTDISTSTAEWLLAAGLSVIVIAAILLGITVWIPVARVATIPGSRVARTPYRIEVLAVLYAMILVAFAFAPSSWSTAGTYSSLTQAALVLSWLIPLTLVLGISLRTSGIGSIWAVTGLGVVVLVEPAFRLIGLAVWSSLNWTSASEWWYLDQGLAFGSGLIVTLASPWLILPTLALIVVVLLWNSQPAPVDGPYCRSTPTSAPLDAWSGVAFVLAFIPLIAFPALILGHISYERITSSDKPLRGRLLAATAITLGTLNVFVLLVVGRGSIDSIGDLWIWG